MSVEYIYILYIWYVPVISDRSRWLQFRTLHINTCISLWTVRNYLPATSVRNYRHVPYMATTHHFNYLGYICIVGRVTKKQELAREGTFRKYIGVPNFKGFKGGLGLVYSICKIQAHLLPVDDSLSLGHCPMYLVWSDWTVCFNCLSV